MFILFGFGKRTIKSQGYTQKRHCPNCGNVRKWECKKVTTWFTLFFIPVIPYKFENVVECPICHVGLRIVKDEVDKYCSGEDTLVDIDNSTLTEVQRNYREEMKNSRND